MLIRGDARHIALQDGCVNCVVTSPPYWGLRDYGHGQDQIGLELTPEAYVASLVTVFREVRRILRNDGTVWLNLGDSYSSARGGQTSGKHAKSLHGKRPLLRAQRSSGLKSKDLIGIPWRVAFALQADGWYLRSDIIWSKPNPMPESVTDRPTKAHEYLFLLAKSEHYYYDADAIKEPYAESTLQEAKYGYRGQATKEILAGRLTAAEESLRRRRGMVDGITKRFTIRAGVDTHGGGQGHGSITFSGDGRNRRSVWTVPTMPYDGAHFATMPERLVEPCILGGCELGGLVADPFVGSGTVGAVAERLGRRWVGLDLTYQTLAQKRTAQRGLKFHAGSAAS